MWTTCSRSGRSSRLDQPGVQPLVVGVLGGELGLDLVVLDDPVLGGVDEEHPARLQPALADDLGRVDVEHADLGGEDDQAVVGDPVAAGAQAVAVEHGADLGAVGEGDAGRAVPGLHQRGVELVEGAPRRVHLGVVLPRLRDHHQHRVRQRAPAEVQQLEHLVEGRRVGGARACRSGRAARGRRGIRSLAQLRLAGPHPVAVAHDGVDLAVVRDEAVRVGQRPAREGVGGEAGVHHGERRLANRSSSRSGKKLVQLAGGEHALVDEGAGGQRREVDVGLALGALAQAERQPLEGHAGRSGRPRRGDEELAEGRHHASGRWRRAARGRSARRASRGRSAPPRRRSASIWPPGLARPGLGVAGQEGDADGVGARRRAGRSRTTSRRNASGTWSRMPAPSPESARRRRRRGGRGCAGRSAPARRCRGWPRRSGWPRRRRRRRRARKRGS